MTAIQKLTFSCIHALPFFPPQTDTQVEVYIDDLKVKVKKVFLLPPGFRVPYHQYLIGGIIEVSSSVSLYIDEVPEPLNEIE